MSYHLHQNTHWLMFNIYFLLFLFQMFYTCPWRHPSLKCYFYCFYLGTMCKNPCLLTGKTTEWCCCYSLFEDLKSSSTDWSISVTNWDIWNYILCVSLILTSKLAFFFLLPCCFWVNQITKHFTSNPVPASVVSEFILGFEVLEGRCFQPKLCQYFILSLLKVESSVQTHPQRHRPPNSWRHQH